MSEPYPLRRRVKLSPPLAELFMYRIEPPLPPPKTPIGPDPPNDLFRPVADVGALARQPRRAVAHRCDGRGPHTAAPFGGLPIPKLLMQEFRSMLLGTASHRD